MLKGKPLLTAQDLNLWCLAAACPWMCALQVACGWHHTLCLTAQSHVFAWGANSEGQLGVGDLLDRALPCRLGALWALPVVRVAAGGRHSAALTAAQELLTWGCDCHGQVSGSPAQGQAAAMGRPACSQHPGPSCASGCLLHPESSGTTAALPTPATSSSSVHARHVLEALIEMGVPVQSALAATVAAGDGGVEAAVEWLFGEAGRDPQQLAALALASAATQNGGLGSGAAAGTRGGGGAAPASASGTGPGDAAATCLHPVATPTLVPLQVTGVRVYVWSLLCLFLAARALPRPL